MSLFIRTRLVGKEAGEKWLYDILYQNSHCFNFSPCACTIPCTSSSPCPSASPCQCTLPYNRTTISCTSSSPCSSTILFGPYKDHVSHHSTNLTCNQLSRHARLLKLSELRLMGQRDMSMLCSIRRTMLGPCLGHIWAMFWLFLQYLCFQMPEMAQIAQPQAKKS